MTKKAAFLVRWRPKNYYSFASLVPILKSFNFPLFLMQKAPLETFTQVVDKFERIYYFDSFMSIDVPKIQEEMRQYYAISGSSKVIFCAGGSHPTAAPEHTLSLGFNIAARGEGEIIIQKIVEVIQNEGSWSEIPGITFKDEFLFIQHNKTPPRIDLNDYMPYSVDPPITPPIEIMRGCSFGCKFCQTPRVLRKVRYRSIESIDQIVSYYVDRFKTRNRIDIRFIAPNSLEYGSNDHRTPNIDVLWDLVKTVKKYPVRMYLGSFPSEIRPEFINKETVEILLESHSKSVAVGAQSGTDSMLDKMKRGHSISDIEKAVELLLNADLIPNLDFILGNPTETDEEQIQTLDFCKSLVKKGCKVRLHYFMPLPGTPWGDAPPTPLSSFVKKEIFLLLKHKLVEGSFSQQMNIAEPLLSYR